MRKTINWKTKTQNSSKTKVETKSLHVGGHFDQAKHFESITLRIIVSSKLSSNWTESISGLDSEKTWLNLESSANSI